jgi:hypothetical protein
MTQKRARDPGSKLGEFGYVIWVHCPKCDGPAKLNGSGVSCLRCNHVTIQKTEPSPLRWARIRSPDPRCTHCGTALSNQAMPTALEKDGALFVRVKCPQCTRTVDYRGEIGFPPSGASTAEPEWLRRYLETQVGGETLWVNNLAHLDALEAYLGATIRERGPVAGLTMMARLPAWMKSATMRPKVLRGLKTLRDRADHDGITE